MSGRRLSKRSSAVYKRRLLELKLEKRRIRAEVRIQKARSRIIQKSKFANEAARLRNILSENCDQISEHSSLEWDHSDESPPSFISCQSGITNSDQIVKEILEDIVNLDDSIELSDAEFVNERRNTSTDNNFLDVAVDKVPPFNHLHWPPRLPSQEPDFNPVVHSSLAKGSEASNLDSINEELTEVFEEEFGESEAEEQNNLKMDAGDYNDRLKVIKLESRKVKNEMNKLRLSCAKLS